MRQKYYVVVSYHEGSAVFDFDTLKEAQEYSDNICTGTVVSIIYGKELNTIVANKSWVYVAPDDKAA
jgi:hypothetical protein